MASISGPAACSGVGIAVVVAEVGDGHSIASDGWGTPCERVVIHAQPLVEGCLGIVGLSEIVKLSPDF